MKELIRIELYKILKRKDFLFLNSMILIPLFYAIGSAMESSIITYEGSTKTYGLKFCVEMYSFIYMVFIYFFILAMFVIRSLRGELENKSIRLYVQRINNRRKIYLSKNISMVIAFTGVTIFFFLISLIAFYIFVIQREDIATATFVVSSELGLLIATSFSIYLYFIWSIFYSYMLSAYMKSGTALGLYVLTIVFWVYLKEFPYVKYLSPAYYTQSIIDYSSSYPVTSIILQTFLVIIGYCIVFYYLGRNKFEKSDI